MGVGVPSCPQANAGLHKVVRPCVLRFLAELSDMPASDSLLVKCASDSTRFVRICSTEERRLHTTCLETAKKAMENFGLFE